MAANEQPGAGGGTTTKLSGWVLFAAFVVLLASRLILVMRPASTSGSSEMRT